MFSPNQQMAKVLNVQLPSSYGASDGGGLSQAESLVHSSKELEDELVSLGKNIKHHEENIKHLKTCITTLDDQITDMLQQVTLGKNDGASDKKDVVVENIIMQQHQKSGASIICQLKNTNTNTAAAADPIINDEILGVVATLGKVNDDNLSRILSEYLGVDTMLALVCMTYDGVQALETYDKQQGFITKTSGLHALSLSIASTPIHARFHVICLQNLRPYVGEFIPNDPQKRLALLKPKLPNGEPPQGFLGFAVNMIHLDMSSLTSGLRETLFYNLFSSLQVYNTRAHMLQALPFLSNGAVSLDGGLIRSNGVMVFGTRDAMKEVRFAPSSDNMVDIEKKMKELKWKKETTVEQVQREEAILTHVKYTFEVKKQEFVRFMAQTSPYVMQYPPIQATPRRLTPRS